MDGGVSAGEPFVMRVKRIQRFVSLTKPGGEVEVYDFVRDKSDGGDKFVSGKAASLKDVEKPAQVADNRMPNIARLLGSKP